MIERFNLDNDTDIASVLGRGTLIAGSAYGLYKAGSGLSSVKDAGHFRRSMGRFSNIETPSVSKTENVLSSNVGFQSFMKNKGSSQIYNKKYQTIDDIIGRLTGGYKGRSSGLGSELNLLYSDLKKNFGDVRFSSYEDLKGNLSSIRISADNNYFNIPIVGSDASISLSNKNNNRYTSRSVLKDYNLNSKKVELEGLDVSLTRKYREELSGIMAGKISPKDIQRAATDRAIWETTKGVNDSGKTSAEALQVLRKEQAVVDLFGEYKNSSRLSMLKDITSIPGYAGSSAGMLAKGVFTTPDSLISKGLPGAESSISSYQLIRQSQFTGAPKSSINWTPGIDMGIGEFKVASANSKEALKRAAKKVGMNLGEIADEEAILSSRLNVGIKNKMYNFNIDMSKPQTKFMQKLLRDVYSSAEAAGIDPMKVSSAMSGGEMNKSIQERLSKALSEVDLNKGYQRLQSREIAISREIDILKSKRKGASPKELQAIERQISGRYSGLQQVRKAMENFGVLGYDEVGGQIRVPTGDMNNTIRNIQANDGKLSIATESHYKFGPGSKLFTGGGGGKWTIKGVNDVPMIMGWMEAEKIYGPNATLAQAKDLSGSFADVSMISAEAPVKIKGGALAPRESMTAVMSYAAGIMERGSPEEIARLEEIGIKGGEFTGSKLSGKELIEKISSWHKGSSIDDIFGGEKFLSGNVTNMSMAPDISSTQAGIGKTATLSDRAAFNLQAIGLDEVLDNFLSRRKDSFSPFAQLKELEAAKSIAADSSAKGVSINSLANDMDRVFQSDIGARKKFMEGQDRLTISLGKKLGNLEKVTVFSSEAMTPYIGEGKGGMSQLDRTTKDLLMSISKGEDESFQMAKAKKYQENLEQVEESISGNLFKTKVKGSIYGQAVSSLEGMDEAATELGKKMGLSEGMQAPLIAMSKADIKRKFGKEALKQAVEGNLWGIMTREPIEGVHSSLPVNISVAEDFGVPAKMPGAIYLSGEDASKSLIRRSMFVDFDKDTLNVIAATSSKATEQIKDFYGLGGKAQTASGSEFLKSLERMSAFQLKGREPLSITDLMNDELIALNTSQKHLEKGLIGSFSNEFKNVHMGLREQLRPNMGKVAAEAYYLGEDFSHLFVENILKAKHQSKEALIAGSVESTLDLFRGTVGTKYAQMGKGEKAVGLQNIFDQLSFGNKELADSVRSSAGAVSEELAERMGFAKEMAQARTAENASDRVAEVLQQATKQRDAFSKISSVENLTNVIDAHTLGRKLQETGDYSSKMATQMLSSRSGIKARLADVSEVASAIMNKGLKNVVKYGILPTAGIGLIASLTTKPKVLEPSLETGKLHESGTKKFTEPEPASSPRTLFSLPQPKASGFEVRGDAGRRTNFDMLKNQANRNLNDTRVAVHDNRSHLNKYTVEEMIGKGY